MPKSLYGANAADDTISQLQDIKKIMFCHDTVKFSLHAIKNATKCFHNIEQSRTANVNEYFDQFNNAADIVIYSGYEIGTELGAIKIAEEELRKVYETANEENNVKIRAKAKEFYVATSFFLGAVKNDMAVYWRTQKTTTTQRR